MAWVTMTSGQVADASDMNERFNFLCGGTRLPRSSSGVDFTSTTGVYDLGSDSARWNDVWTNNINLDGSVSSASNTIWGLISEVTLSATASSIEFTSLTGDTYTSMMIYARMNVDTKSNQFMIFNGDSAANYGRQFIYGQSTSVASGRNTGLVHMQVGLVATTTVRLTGCRIMAHTKSGHERSLIVHTYGGASGTTIYRDIEWVYLWNDTANTITSLKIYTDAGNFETGTSIKLWGRK